MARWAWPAGVAAAGVAWYAADSLRHRREGGHGYELRGEVDVGEPSFLRAAEALTGAPVSYGNDVELLINGDRIFPAYLDAIRGRRRPSTSSPTPTGGATSPIEVADTLLRARSERSRVQRDDRRGGRRADGPRPSSREMREAGVNFC